MADWLQNSMISSSAQRLLFTHSVMSEPQLLLEVLINGACSQDTAIVDALIGMNYAFLNSKPGRIKELASCASREMLWKGLEELWRSRCKEDQQRTKRPTESYESEVKRPRLEEDIACSPQEAPSNVSGSHSE